MLKQRIITAVVLLVGFALLLTVASPTVFAFSLSCIVAAAAWEWSRLCGVQHEHAQTGFAIVVGVVSLLALHSPLVDSGIQWVLLVGLLFWLSVPVQFYLRPVLPQVDKVQVVGLAVGLLVLPITVLALQYLRSYAPAASNALLLYSMAVIWVMDTGAYFSGRKFGKRKLALLISPGKSWEGVYGGLACSGILFLLVLLVAGWTEGAAFKLLIATILAAGFSVVGDLYESTMKRASGMKDSSQLLPGHGGVLDRLDGVLAALPVFAFFWAWM